MYAKKFCLIGFLVLGLVLTDFVHAANALTFSYSDDLWSITISGPDRAEPGDIVTYNITGVMKKNGQALLHLKVLCNTASTSGKVILELDAVSQGSYSVGDRFQRIYQVVIPPDVINDSYIWFDMYTTTKLWSDLSSITRYFYGIIVTSVQNPSYGEIQTQNANLQSQVNSLQLQVSSLQNDKDSLQNQVNTLQSQVNTLQSEKNTAQTQINSLQSQVNTLKTEKSGLQTQMDDLQSKVKTLESQINSLNGQITTATYIEVLLGVVAVVFVVTTVYLGTKRKP